MTDPLGRIVAGRTRLTHPFRSRDKKRGGLSPTCDAVQRGTVVQSVREIDRLRALSNKCTMHATLRFRADATFSARPFSTLAATCTADQR